MKQPRYVKANDPLAKSVAAYQIIVRKTTRQEVDYHLNLTKKRRKYGKA